MLKKEPDFKKLLQKIQGWQVGLFFIWLFFFIFLHGNSFLTPLHPDEGEYAYSAWLIKQGKVPYEDAFIQKPPLIIYTYFLGQLFDKTGVWSPRFLAFLFTFFSSLLLALVAKKEWGSRAFWLTLWLYPVINLFPGFTPYTANTEKFLLLPLIGILALTIFARQSAKPLPHFLGGILLALTVFYKPVAFPIGGFILATWLIRILLIKRQLYSIIVPSLFQILGFSLAAFLILLPFILSLSFGDFFNAVVAFNRYYAMSDYFSFFNFLWFGLALFRYWWILVLGILAFILFKPGNWFLYLMLFMVSLLNILSAPFGHYYILIAPFLSLVVTGGFTAGLKKILSFPRLAKFEHQLTIGLVMIVLFLLIKPFFGRFFLNSAELSRWLYNRDFLDSVEVAKQIKTRSLTKDQIFVTCSEPQIYFYAKRQSVSRFIILFPLNLSSPFQKEYQKEVERDIFEEKPQFIVRCNLDEHQGYWGELPPKISHQLFGLLKEDYRLIGGWVNQDERGFWWERPNKENDLMLKSNFLVYQRID